MAKELRLPRRAAPGLVPDSLVGRTANCTKCNATNAINWLEKLPFPKQPILAVDGRYWVPMDFRINCSACAEQISVPIPDKGHRATMELYGDEAFRTIDKPTVGGASPLFFFCITLAGLSRNFRPAFEKQLHALKLRASPNRQPDTWPLHFTELMMSSGQGGMFAFTSNAEKFAFGADLARFIAESRPQLFTYNVSGCMRLPAEQKEKLKILRHVKQELFALAILGSLELLRDHQVTPRWTFDNIKDTTDGPKTEGWAQEVFLGLQDTPLFAWLSSGAVILEPKFASPGSHFLSEVADFISYCSAREFQKTVTSQTTELPTKLLGWGNYAAVIGDGSVDSTRSEGLPLKQFYGIQPRS